VRVAGPFADVRPVFLPHVVVDLDLAPVHQPPPPPREAGRFAVAPSPRPVGRPTRTRLARRLRLLEEAISRPSRICRRSGAGCPPRVRPRSMRLLTVRAAGSRACRDPYRGALAGRAARGSRPPNGNLDRVGVPPTDSDDGPALASPAASVREREVDAEPLAGGTARRGHRRLSPALGTVLRHERRGAGYRDRQLGGAGRSFAGTAALRVNRPR
jgi:hypothetical protein